MKTNSTVSRNRGANKLRPKFDLLDMIDPDDHEQLAIALYILKDRQRRKVADAGVRKAVAR